jgi:hypothetical protein
MFRRACRQNSIKFCMLIYYANLVHQFSTISEERLAFERKTVPAVYPGLPGRRRTLRGLFHSRRGLWRRVVGAVGCESIKELRHGESFWVRVRHFLMEVGMKQKGCSRKIFEFLVNIQYIGFDTISNIKFNFHNFNSLVLRMDHTQ